MLALRPSGTVFQTSLGGWSVRAGSYIARFKKVLNSWLTFNGMNVKLKVNVRGESETLRITDERMPSKEELD